MHKIREMKCNAILYQIERKLRQTKRIRAGACAVVRAIAFHQCGLGWIAEATPNVARVC